MEITMIDKIFEKADQSLRLFVAIRSNEHKR